MTVNETRKDLVKSNATNENDLSSWNPTDFAMYANSLQEISEGTAAR